jgi:hypothetical protein
VVTATSPSPLLLESAPTATHVDALGQDTPASVPTLLGSESVFHDVPPSVVARSRVPTATQKDVVGHEMLWRWEPGALTSSCVVHADPELDAPAGMAATIPIEVLTIARSADAPVIRASRRTGGPVPPRRCRPGDSCPRPVECRLNVSMLILTRTQGLFLRRLSFTSIDVPMQTRQLPAYDRPVVTRGDCCE